MVREVFPTEGRKTERGVNEIADIHASADERDAGADERDAGANDAGGREVHSPAPLI